MDSHLIEIDTPTDEDLVATLLLYATSEYMQKEGLNSKYLNNIKLQKIIFRTCDELNIPLTRSWYKRGCFVHNSNIKVEYLNHILRSEMNLEELTQFKSEHETEYTSIYKTAAKHISNTFFTDTELLLDKLYDFDAPSRYKTLYKANNIILVTNQQIKKSLNDISAENPNRLLDRRFTNKYYYYKLLSNSISQVHIELATNREFELIIDPYIYFTDFLEDIYVKIDNILLPRRNVPVEISKFFESLDWIYYDYVWGCPSQVISKATMTGALAEEYKELAEKELKNSLDNFDKVLDKNKEMSERIGLKPTLDEWEDVDKNLMALSEAGFDEDLIEFWKMYNKV